MSEWYNSQKKPIVDFRKLLQERLDKVNPRRKLAKDETTKLAKLEGIAEKLKRGEHVQNRQLQTWLSEDEYAQVDIEWQEQLEIREELKDKPSELKRYEEKLKQATFYYNRAEGYSSKGKKVAALSAAAKCESLCEDALEILQEIVATDASLQIWFDRNLDFGHGSLIDASLGNLPRLVTSRSIEKLCDDSRLVKKIDVKISVVERAIDSVGRDTAVPSKGDSLMLEKFLNTDF
ncbi:hypothetical protein N9X47_00030 [Porticoccaceae bacterium]|nr:hypothetical protein [Porticoccaceae bacterium]